MFSVLTVDTVATTYDLTTLATVKAELGITGSTEDTNIARWISEASAACSSYCNRVFGRETVIETYRMPQAWPNVSRKLSDKIYLKRIPVGTVTSTIEDGTALVEDTDYQTDRINGFLYRLDSDSLVSWSFSKLVIKYAGGYAAITDLPDDIERACITQVKTLRSAGTRDPLVKQESIPGVLETAYWVGGVPGSTGNLSPDVTALLDPYREIAI